MSINELFTPKVAYFLVADRSGVVVDGMEATGWVRLNIAACPAVKNGQTCRASQLPGNHSPVNRFCGSSPA